MAQQKVEKGVQIFKQIREAIDGNAEDSTEQFTKKLDKLTLSPQTVASEVEFFQEITVPPNSLILGKDGAKLSSSGRALQFGDAFKTNQYFPFFEVKATGNENPKYYKPEDEITAIVNPDAGIILSDPQDMAFATAVSNTFTVAFIIIPATAGKLMVQTWVGSDDTGAVLVENEFTVLAGDVGTELQLDIPNPIMLFIGDSIFTRFSGVRLEGAVQSSGPFIGELKPFLKSCLNILTPKNLVSQDTNYLDFSPQSPQAPYKEGRLYYNAVRETLDFYNAVSNITVNLPEESIQPVYNDTGITITNGQAVKLTGAVTGVIPNVDLALADTVDSANVSGVATHDIPDGTKGYITLLGSVGGFDTSSFSAGDVLFLSNSTPGGLEKVEQEILNPIAICLVSDSTEGIILVKPRGVINITAIAQTRGQSYTQDITTTPVICYCFDLAQFALNVNVSQTINPGAGTGYNAVLSPISIGASGYYRFTFSASLSSNDNERFTLELYINGLPTGLVANIDLNNPSTEYGTATISGVTESIITPSDNLEIYIYHNGGAGTDTVTYDSSLFGIERIGNA